MKLISQIQNKEKKKLIKFSKNYKQTKKVKWIIISK